MLLRLSCVSGWLALLDAVADLLSLIPVATGDEFVPRTHQLDISLDNFSGFVARTSQVHVRENTLTGSRFHLASALGLRRMDIPSIVLTYWFDDRNAIQIHFRYFDAAGSHRLRQPATFNGTTLTASQRLNPRGTLWMDGAVYYQRRLTPWLQPFVGLGYVYYRQNEQSHEDGNFIRLSVCGPEFGISYSF